MTLHAVSRTQEHRARAGCFLACNSCEVRHHEGLHHAEADRSVRPNKTIQRRASRVCAKGGMVLWSLYNSRYATNFPALSAEPRIASIQGQSQAQACEPRGEQAAFFSRNHGMRCCQAIARATPCSRRGKLRPKRHDPTKDTSIASNCKADLPPISLVSGGTFSKPAFLTSRTRRAKQTALPFLMTGIARRSQRVVDLMGYARSVVPSRLQAVRRLRYGTTASAGKPRGNLGK